MALRLTAGRGGSWPLRLADGGLVFSSLAPVGTDPKPLSHLPNRGRLA